VNRVLVAGKLQEQPRVAYTPKGKKVITFPLWVEEEALSIEVVFKSQHGSEDLDKKVGSTILITGVLTKTKIKSHDVFRVEANKIAVMEE